MNNVLFTCIQLFIIALALTLTGLISDWKECASAMQINLLLYKGESKSLELNVGSCEPNKPSSGSASDIACGSNKGQIDYY